MTHGTDKTRPLESVETLCGSGRDVQVLFQNPFRTFVNVNRQRADVVLTVADAVRFRRRVCRGTRDQCWPFPVGSVALGGDRKRPAQWVAASVAARRTLRPDEVVRARCTTPRCCNPSHLRVLVRSDARHVALRPVAASLPSRPEETTCSYCGMTGGDGRAVVCGLPIPCPACSAPSWPDAVPLHGAHSA